MGSGFTQWQMRTLLARIEHIINSRPIGVSRATENEAESRVLTPLHLVGASALYDRFPIPNYVLRRSEAVDAAVDAFWTDWKRIVAPGLIRAETAIRSDAIQEGALVLAVSYTHLRAHET